MSQWDAGLYQEKHSFVWKMTKDLVALLDPRFGERILDLGCGTGQLTEEIAASGARVTGLDSAPEMIAAARERNSKIDWVLGNAADFRFDELFDAVFSNAVLHWVPEAEPVARCVFNALRPGGRFIAEFGGKGNIREIVAAIVRALTEAGERDAEERNPWYFPGIAEYATVLEGVGLEVTLAKLIDRPTPLEGESGMRDWMKMFGSAFRAGEVVPRIEELTRPSLFRDGRWSVDYRRLRVVARRP